MYKIKNSELIPADKLEILLTMFESSAWHGNPAMKSQTRSNPGPTDPTHPINVAHMLDPFINSSRDSSWFKSFCRRTRRLVSDLTYTGVDPQGV
jgi:hypothetical protein